MSIHLAFLGHGIVTEFPNALLKRYTGWLISAGTVPSGFDIVKETTEIPMAPVAPPSGIWPVPAIVT
jgi:hypothetical protein